VLSEQLVVFDLSILRLHAILTKRKGLFHSSDLFWKHVLHTSISDSHVPLSQVKFTYSLGLFLTVQFHYFQLFAVVACCSFIY